ncbi:hypothetical protein ABW19_dt0202387 [Dactylella cylindrospora]|nr:hypothetical protein ABW19_dt0202387 [Dactylella cylindrospora]
MQEQSEAVNHVENAPSEDQFKMTDHKEWEGSSTNPAAMPAAPPPSATPVSADAGTASVPIAKPQLSTSTESNLSTSLSKLEISPKSPTRPLQESLSQDLPSSPPAPAPPPKDRRLPAPEDVLSKAQTAQQKPSLPALPQADNDRLHPGYSTSGQPHHNRSLSGSSILDTEEEEGQDTKGEIRSIMSQFSPKLPPQDVQEEKPTADESDLNPPLSPIPPRTSSLENLMAIDRSTPRSPVSEKSHTVTPQLSRRFSKTLDPLSPTEPAPPPPAPDPEPPQPFDFHRFLEQLRHRTADPVARFLRSFLNEFGKRQWQVHEQVKIISDFLEFIHGKMAICEVWREVSDAEFDNAKEGMEKLVMNRLYTQTFSPAIPPPQQANKRGKRRENPNMPGRRGQHQEDVERDEILSQKVSIYGWVREEHLDIKPVGESGRKFLSLACQELLKINNYRAPRDKVICVLNCCKVIFGMRSCLQSGQGVAGL